MTTRPITYSPEQYELLEKLLLEAFEKERKAGYRAGLESVQAKMHDLNTYSYRHDWQALSDWIDAQLREAQP